MSYGIACFSSSGTKIFGSEFRTSNAQYVISLVLTANATSQFFPMADANDSTKVVITYISDDRFIPNRFTISTSSTGFSFTNTRNYSGTLIGIAFRIG